MVCLGDVWCPRCMKTYSGNINGSPVCGECKKKENDAYFAELEELSLVDRIRRLEKLMNRGEQSHYNIRPDM